MNSASEPMANLRPSTAAGTPISQARVLGAIFGDQDTTGAFGKYRVLDRLSAGGMGVVYEAYDPDLARGVALKLVDVRAADRETALAEAQALARLSHPNVVPIHDVGLEGDRVYLVMELVRGKTLRDWVHGRRLRDIVDIHLQAGRGLAAAHDVGLVHRDFKPENAIVGSDGRVRVVDFGLACEADGPRHAAGKARCVAGTPGYMAPELKEGAAITPSVDQYSFCVALGEALQLTQQPTPRHITTLLARGQANDPADRFASMDDLLRALARDPARARRQIAAIAALAATVGVVAFFLGKSTPRDSCSAGDATLEDAWSRSVRSSALHRLDSLHPYDPLLRERIGNTAQEHIESWKHQYRKACDDHSNGTDSDTMYEHRRSCLMRSADALAEVGRIIGSADPTNLAELPRAVHSLPDPAVCSDREAVMSDIEQPRPYQLPVVATARRGIEQARVQLDAGRYKIALDDARGVVEQARASGYGPVLAEALVVQGHAQMQLDATAAVPMLSEAMTLAMRSKMDDVAVEAWARRAYALGTETDQLGALAGLDLVELFAQRDTHARFARALLHNNVGAVELGRGHRDKAREHLMLALTEAQKLTGRGMFELLGIRTNLALATDDRREADLLLAALAGELTRLLGENHPDTLVAREIRGFAMIEDLTQASETLTGVCHGFDLHPTLHRKSAACWTEVGLLRSDLGEIGQAIQAMELAVHASTESAEADGYLSLLRGDSRSAARKFDDAIARITATSAQGTLMDLPRAALALGLGRARRDTGDLRGAREILEHAIATLEPLVAAHPSARQERRLGRARVALALTLHAQGAGSTELGPVATAALAWQRRVGAPTTKIAPLAADVRTAH